jgi:hypothetical protein
MVNPVQPSMSLASVPRNDLNAVNVRGGLSLANLVAHHWSLSEPHVRFGMLEMLLSSDLVDPLMAVRYLKTIWRSSRLGQGFSFSVCVGWEEAAGGLGAWEGALARNLFN